jgi:hypothetical protein
MSHALEKGTEAPTSERAIAGLPANSRDAGISTIAFAITMAGKCYSAGARDPRRALRNADTGSPCATRADCVLASRIFDKTNMFHTLLAAFFDQDSWTKCQEAVESSLSRAQGSYVEVGFGTWVFKTKECFWLLDDLKALFKSQGVNFVSVPLYDALQVCLEPKIAEALERKLHLDVYNVAEPVTRR